MAMRPRRLGRGGPDVGELGLGCMGMSDFYGPADRTESLATIHAALETGATLLETPATSTARATTKC
jgi:aryl-alcohol dehydrogenase-like predicted oxidoreductase